MSSMQSLNDQPLETGLARRKVVKAAAWSLPVIAVAISAPSAAASTMASPLANYSWYFAQNQVGSVGNRELQASTNINVNKADASLPDAAFTVTYTIAFTAYADADKTTEIVAETKTFDPVLYSGSHQETSSPLLWTRVLTAAEWPPSGGSVWVEYRVISAIATTVSAPVQSVNILHSDAYGSMNPYTANGYISSW